MIKLKAKHRWAITHFAQENDRSYFRGAKLEALHRLIQRRGEEIFTDGDLRGVKALEFNKGDFVAMIHRPYNAPSFFPCKLHTIHLNTDYVESEPTYQPW